ncbi:MAG: pyridoxal phosphate-dependent aminotransferase [Phycisphaerales bacterium]
MSGTPRLSRRAASIKPPATFAVAAKAKALRQRGIDVLGMSLGEPDFDTPEPARRAAIDAINAGQTHYVPTMGDGETRAVVAEKFTRENRLPDVTGDHVSISVGAKHSLFLVAQALLDDEGGQGTGPSADVANEVLLPVPSWVSYAPIAMLAGGRVVELPTTPEADFKITPAQLRGAITARSRMLLLNTPSNPCGTMYTPSELRALAAVIAEAAGSVAPDLVIVVDEIYEKIVFGGIEHLSIGSLPGVAGRTITINGLSKAYAMTGWRVGFAAASGEFGRSLAKAIDGLQGQMTSCLPAFIYPAIRAALKECGAASETMRAEFARRATLIHGLAKAIPGLRTRTPTGAFYLFPDVSAFFGKRTLGGKTLRTSLDFADALLEEARLAVVPGEEFGGCGANHIRLSYACSQDQIREGMGRLAAFTASLK